MIPKDEYDAETKRIIAALNADLRSDLEERRAAGKDATPGHGHAAGIAEMLAPFAPSPFREFRKARRPMKPLHGRR